jgi:hypothetical protein
LTTQDGAECGPVRFGLRRLRRRQRTFRLRSIEQRDGGTHRDHAAYIPSSGRRRFRARENFRFRKTTTIRRAGGEGGGLHLMAERDEFAASGLGSCEQRVECGYGRRRRTADGSDLRGVDGFAEEGCERRLRADAFCCCDRQVAFGVEYFTLRPQPIESGGITLRLPLYKDLAQVSQPLERVGQLAFACLSGQQIRKRQSKIGTEATELVVGAPRAR